MKRSEMIKIMLDSLDTYESPAVDELFMDHILKAIEKEMYPPGYTVRDGNEGIWHYQGQWEPEDA